MLPPDMIRKIRRIQIRTSRLATDVFAGPYLSAFKGQGIEFEEVREYVPGDDVRTIDWNVTARSGAPHVKTFREERELTVMLLVDVSASNAFGSTPQRKCDLAAEIAAVLAFSAIRNNDRVGLILFTDDVEHYIPPRRGVSHVLRVIRDILYFRPARAGTSLAPALRFLDHVRHRRSVAFLVSDYLDTGFQRAMSVTARRHDLVAVLVGDRRESVWPEVGLVAWEDAESGRRVLADSSDPRTRLDLATGQRERREALLQFMRTAGVDTVEVYAGESYEKEFIRFFQARERRLRA
jgi:uncharacterized protein (DUF58 family)